MKIKTNDPNKSIALEVNSGIVPEEKNGMPSCPCFPELEHLDLNKKNERVV